jgi:hypothetical protein
MHMVGERNTDPKRSTIGSQQEADLRAGWERIQCLESSEGLYSLRTCPGGLPSLADRAR